ncbi:unnamed protein product [Urochloa decumbens]|uniref:DUF4378 domain-containing protein n=1 Tax=Urochloa decumbens TaxID=240449 RepID=A0ABC8WY90_9POAL
MPPRMAKGFSQEVSDFDRQMGCMASMFQIFDRCRLLTSRRRGGSLEPSNKLPPGHDLPGGNTNAPVLNSANPNTSPEVLFSTSTAENGMLSMESSKVSSSSSSCSSLSSLDSSKPVQQELPYIKEEPVVGRTVRSSQSLNSCDKEVKSKQRNTDFRDVVKDSINRGLGVLPIKTTTMAQRKGLHKDSPRPLLISKSTDGTYVIAVDRSNELSAYVDESRRQPRFSCDDRHLLQQAEDQDSQMPSSKLRVLPRLSLDSRKESVRPSWHMKNFGYAKTDDNLNDDVKSQESPSHRRTSGVIAKLMGLEDTLGSSGSARSHRHAHDIQNGNPSYIPRSIHPDPSLTQPIVQPPILKTKPSARMVPEAAPWKQQERGIRRYYDEAKPRSVSTYNDIERRLAHLAFSECNKDLRALGILGNLHAKNTPCQRDYNARLLPIQKATTEGNTTGQDLQSPVVIIKPARGITRPNASGAPLVGLKIHKKLQHEECPFTRKSDSSGRKKTHSHNERAHSRADEAVGSIISPSPSRSLSPRLVLRKSDCGRIPHLAVPPTSPAKALNEVVSPRGRLRSRASQANSICRDDKMSMVPESRISLSKQVDMAIIDYPNPINGNTACSHQSNTTSTLTQEETPPILSSDKNNIHSLENILSPVSVLDAMFCQNRSSPSLRILSNSFQDVATHTLDECWNLVSLPDTPTLKKKSEGNHIIPENMKALIQKLELLQLLSDEAPGANDNSLTITANKYHHYIYEILSASGLLHSELSSRMMPCQFQLPSHAINPEIFLVLEQAKPAAGKLHRKLIFDLANELIAQKIHGGGSVRQQLQMIKCNKSSGWNLFKELCSEIEMLHPEASIIRLSEEKDEESKLAKNAVREMGKWKSFDCELQGIVVDIERYIFKNLIDEALSSEAMRKV